MIDKNKFHVLNYIKREEYTGSMEGMRYMLRKKDVGEENVLEVIIWPEPFGFAKTPENKKQFKEFPFTQEGLDASVDWMNEQYEQQRSLWNVRR